MVSGSVHEGAGLGEEQIGDASGRRKRRHQERQDSCLPCYVSRHLVSNAEKFTDNNSVSVYGRKPVVSKL